MKAILQTIIYLLFIALINSFDNIGIRVAYSIGGIKVQLMKNVLISLMAFVVSFTASLSGNFISNYINEDIASIFSMLLLSGTGLKIIFENYKGDKEKITQLKSLSYKESISIGTALALDDIGGSIGVGLIGYSPVVVGLAFFTISFIIFLSGNYMVRLLSKIKISNKLTTFLAGLLMILIGVLQIIE